MSQTYHLCCVTCRESIWIAQGHSDDLYFYSGDPETLVAFNEFLRKHLQTYKYVDVRHELIFTDSENAAEGENCMEIEVDDNGEDSEPYFHWFLRRRGESITLKEYKGVVVPENVLVTKRIQELLAEGWTLLTVRPGK